MSDTNRLKIIREEILHCQNCALAKGRKNAVPGEGPSSVEVMFLDELLAAANLKRDEVFITNVVKCRPPSNRDPLPEELSACARYLDEQIALLDPKIIVTLGRFSMAKFIQNGRISQIHGKSHRVDGRIVVTMYHPAAALHQPALRPALVEDFAKLPRLLGGESPVEPKAEVFAPESKPEVKPEKKEEKPDLPEQLSLF